MGNIIYTPKGHAREYAPLAANLYEGCSHRCAYCYVPGVFRITAEKFAQAPKPRADIINKLRREADKNIVDQGGLYAGAAEVINTGPVLLSFSSDPYQECEREHQVTAQAIPVLSECYFRVRVLTKNPMFALERDGNMLRKNKVELGTTLLFEDDERAAEWEPGAPPPSERIQAMEIAHKAGIRTWVSIEPVIDVPQALRVIQALEGSIDVWKVGRWNHDERANKIDWRHFARAALELLTKMGAAYYIKGALWESAGEEVRSKFAKVSDGKKATAH
jgi:DNA repair photolyase